MTEVEKHIYIEEYNEKEGIQLVYGKIEKNPGLRAVAKLALNCLWGKFGQRTNLTSTEIIKSRDMLMAYLSNSNLVIHNITLVDEFSLFLNYSLKEHLVEPSAYSNVVIAAFTTCQAVLYDYIEKLGSRALYCDTDSVFFVETGAPNEYIPTTGNYLGDLTDELEEYGEGAYIEEFIAEAPKF